MAHVVNVKIYQIVIKHLQVFNYAKEYFINLYLNINLFNMQNNILTNHVILLANLILN
jgi:hypothetical protein